MTTSGLSEHNRRKFAGHPGFYVLKTFNTSGFIEKYNWVLFTQQLRFVS